MRSGTRGARRRGRLAWLLPVLALGFVLALPAAADDDDSDDGDAPGAAGAPGGVGAPGGSAEGRRGRMDLGPNPGTDFRRDLRGLMGLLFGTPAPPRAVPPSLPLPLPPPSPDPPEAEQDELVARGLSPTARAQALAEGFSVVAERGALTRLRAPAGLDTAAARDRLRAIAPAATVDLNHLYRPGSATAGCRGQDCTPAPFRALIAWPEAPSCGAGLELGLIDTPVDPSLPALAGRLEAVTLRGPDRAPASAAHGTAVATLLAGAGTGAARGLLPGARLIAVDAFHRRPEGDAADAFDIAGAIGLLAARGVAVAAMAFAGPANAVVDEAGAAAAGRGMSAVAASGNDGPHAPPRYPAAHPWAIAVTGVDRDARIFARAVRGPHIDFAAPGVGVPVLVAADRPPVTRSGTSYAVPFVAAALALARATGLGPAEAAERLAAAARDLGPPGRDPIYGWGLVRAIGDC